MVFHMSKVMSTKFILSSFSLLFFTSTSLLSLYILSIDDCILPVEKDERHAASILMSPSKSPLNTHKLALLVPFRDRFDELLAFAPHMHQFLNKQDIDYQIFVLNQVDELRFNRASLINVGFKLIKSKFDYLVVHDVDLLPLSDQLSYKYPETGVFHVSSPQLHPKYHYPTFLGGILIVKSEDFAKVNGMSNRYWGWGLEDDEFYTRLKDAEIVIRRPINISTNINNTFLHTHDRVRRRRDTRKCFNQMAVTRRRDRLTGLHDVRYSVVSSISMTIDNAPLSVINIRLECDHALTPWCQCETPQPPKPPPPEPSKT